MRKLKLASLLLATAVLGTSAFAVAAPELGSKAVRSLAALAPAERPASSPGPIVALRRLSEGQYRNTIADVFGREIKITGQFDPDRRVGGLLASSDTTLSITATGFEELSRVGRAVADQILAEQARAKYLTCLPKDPKAPDTACTKEFLATYGTRLFRRPLSASQMAQRLALAESVTRETGSYYTGLHAALVSLLTAPDFLFRLERASADGKTLDGYSRAARMSGLLWNSAPDTELLRAAGAGELDTEAGLMRQADRLMASPRFQRGMTAFFDDMLQLERVKYLTKDSKIYPKYNDAIARSAPEETRRMVLGFLFTENNDYRDLLTSRRTYINRPLAALYGVPFTFESEWVPYEFPADSGRSGVLTQATFLSAFAHPARSSPTLRGVGLREAFMCDPTPDPPPDVDFSLVNAANNPSLKTLRQKLLAHAEDESCASCHVRTDPIGLALEQFDGIGARRELENGAPIDVSAKLGKKSFIGAQGLAFVLRDDPKIPACLVRNIYAYGSGEDGEEMDPERWTSASEAFAKSGYRVRPLLKHAVSSSSFYAFSAPHGSAPEPTLKVAQRSAR